MQDSIDFIDEIHRSQLLERRPIPDVCGSNSTLHTTVSRKSGDKIFKEMALCTSLNIESLDLYCSSCLRTLTQMKTGSGSCSRCKVVRYCSVQCQKLDWNNGHRDECRYLLKHIKQNYKMDACLLIKLMAKSTSIEASRLAFFDALQSHDEQASTVQIQRMNSIIADSLPFLPAGTTKLKILNILGRFRVNNPAITDCQLRAIGSGVFPCLSMLNHSCLPNCALLFSGDLMSLVALRDLERNEELTISYIDVLNSREDRQRMLLEHYHFKCGCPKCLVSDFWNVKHESICSWKDTLPFCEKLLYDTSFKSAAKLYKTSSFGSGNSKSTFDQKMHAPFSLSQYAHVTRLIDQAMSTSITDSQMSLLCDLNKFVVVAYCLHYGYQTPMFALQLVTVIKCMYNACETVSCNLIEEADRLVGLSFDVPSGKDIIDDWKELKSFIYKEQ